MLLTSLYDCCLHTGWFVFISTVENIFFGGNGWFQEKTFSWWNLDYLNIFQSIYNHFLIWPTFDLKTASGFQKAGIKKWSFGTHQKLVLIYKSMIEKLTNTVTCDYFDFGFFEAIGSFEVKSWSDQKMIINWLKDI